MFSPVELTSRLEAYLKRTGIDARILGARHLTGGASRDSWSVDAEIAGRSQGLVVRRDLGGEISPEALDRGGEFAVLSRAFEGGVRVPRPVALCLDPGVLGAPFFVMERLQGESVGRRVVRDPGLASARQALPGQMGEQLARIHALSLDGLDFLPRPRSDESPAWRALEQTSAQLVALAEPHPALELGIRWLRARVPPCDRVVLVHGDFRVGNLMLDSNGLVGVFDWEFAHVGDPAEDIGWPCVRSWRFGQDPLRLGGVGAVEDLLAAYQRDCGRIVDPGAVRFWEILGNLRWAVGCIAQAQRHLSGQAASVELASLGRRTCEMELELLDLIALAEEQT